MKSTTTKNIQTDIEASFIIIDDYLPKKYTREVKKLVPWVTSNHIRVVRARKTGDIEIVHALRTVAENTKELMNQ